MADKPVLNLEAWLVDNGMTLKGVDAAGQPVAEDAEGRTGALNVRAILADMKLKPEQVNIQYNTPESALDDVPLTMGDRAKMALGNTKGNIGYLKSKFEDVAYSPESGISVKDKGVWKRTDKESMDPYELATDIVEGAIALSPGLIGGTVGAIAGTAAGGPVGSIAGAGAGAGIAEKIRGTLGRVVGTYDATPEEELKNIGWEILLNSGGQALALGARPLLSKLGDAAKSLKHIPEASKNALVPVLSRTTGSQPSTIATLLDAPEVVNKEITKSLAKYGNQTAAQAGLVDDGIAMAQKLVDEAPQALTRKYGELARIVAKDAPDNMSVNAKELTEALVQKIDEAGLGQFIPEQNKLQALSNQSIWKKIFKGQTGETLSDDGVKVVSKLFRDINQIGAAGEAKGANAVHVLMELRKKINASAEAVHAGSDLSAKRIASEVQGIVRQHIVNQMEKHGLSEQYVATSNLYKRYGDAVEMARNLQRTGGPELLVNKLASGVGKNQTYKSLAGDMAELMGQPGQDILEQIKFKSAASELVSVLPKQSLSPSVIGLGAVTSISTGLLPVGAVAGAAAASPRLVARGAGQAAKAFDYAKKFADFTRTMSPTVRATWLKNPQAMDASIRTVFEALGNEENETEQLLRSSGVK